MIAYRGVLLGLVGKMFQGSAPPDVESDSKAASVSCFLGSGGRGQQVKAGRREVGCGE